MKTLKKSISTVALPLLAAATVCFGASGSATVAEEAFSFAAIGDTAYSQRSEKEFENMLGSMNGEDLSFVVHVGDFEADPRPYGRSPDTISKPCVDESFERVLASFQQSAHPFILTPGDNDWTDCHLLKTDDVDPMERLDKLRQMFFPEGKSLGQNPMDVDSQAAMDGYGMYRENLAWSKNGVNFATIHIVGSNDNAGRSAETEMEHQQRAEANIAWLKNAFAEAKASDAKGLVIVTQANVGFESHWSGRLQTRYVRSVAGTKAPEKVSETAFDKYIEAITAEMADYDKPVLFIHGDSHLFRVSKPLYDPENKRFFPNFTRVEVFGDPDSYWVRVNVDPAKPGLFSFEPVVVPENMP